MDCASPYKGRGEKIVMGRPGTWNLGFPGQSNALTTEPPECILMYFGHSVDTELEVSW